MPGFVVQDVGEGAPGRPETYYSYSWRIPWAYANSGLNGPLVYLKQATFPTVSFGKETVQGASLQYKFASDVNWEDVRLSWYDTRGLLELMRQWRSKVWTVDGGLQQPTQYKELTVLSTELPEGGAENQWTLHNSWPSVIRQGELTYTSSDVKLVDVTVTYDWAVEAPG